MRHAQNSDRIHEKSSMRAFYFFEWCEHNSFHSALLKVSTQFVFFSLFAECMLVANQLFVVYICSTRVPHHRFMSSRRWFTSYAVRTKFIHRWPGGGNGSFVRIVHNIIVTISRDGSIDYLRLESSWRKRAIDSHSFLRSTANCRSVECVLNVVWDVEKTLLFVLCWCLILSLLWRDGASLIFFININLVYTVASFAETYATLSLHESGERFPGWKKNDVYTSNSRNSSSFFALKKNSG